MHEVSLAEANSAMQENRVINDIIIFGDTARSGIGQLIRAADDELFKGKLAVQRCRTKLLVILRLCLARCRCRRCAIGGRRRCGNGACDHINMAAFCASLIHG